MWVLSGDDEDDRQLQLTETRDETCGDVRTEGRGEARQSSACRSFLLFLGEEGGGGLDVTRSAPRLFLAIKIRA